MPISGEIGLSYATEKLIYSNTLEEWITHNGIDILGEEAEPVKAIEAGTIESVKMDPRYGNTIIIKHNDEYKSIYSIFIEKYNKGFYSENKSQNENRKDHYYKKQEEHRKSDHSKTNKEYSHNSRQISSKEKNAYAILGVESNATDDEIKKAYRAMAIKCHPDNASNLGDEAIRQATESMKQINMAWETVKMARGIK